MNDRVKSVIYGKRHPNYQKTVNDAILAKKIVTGKDYGTLIYSYRSRETKSQKKQRVDITHIRTKSIAGKVTGFYERVTRADKLRFAVTHESSNDQANQVSSHLDVYGNNGESALKWVERAANFYNDVDANVFYWVKESINKKGDQEFEPHIFTSDQVLDYKTKKGVILWCVCCMIDIVTYIKEGVQEEKEIKYYYYFDENGLEISVEKDPDVQDNYSSYYTKLSEGSEVMQEDFNDKTYIVLQEDPYTDFVPVTNRVGYKFDLTTNQETFVTRWDNASELYKILVEDGSGLDITKKLHIFPKQITYYTPCKYEDKKRNAVCRGGIMYPHNGTCPKCKGTGEQIHLSDQDVIKVKLPEKDDQTVINPKDLVHYVETPDKILDFQNEAVNAATATILEAIFGVDLAYQETGAVTATQVNTYRDLAQDALFQFSSSPRHMYLFTASVVKSALGYDDVNVELEYTNEYNLESEEYLLNLLDKAVKAQARPEIQESIQQRIILKQNRTNKAFLEVHQAMRPFLPFKGLSEAMKMQIVGTLPNSSLQKALFLNFAQITDDIMSNEKGFSMLTYEQRQKIVNDRAQEFADMAIEDNKVTSMNDIFNEEIQEEEL